MHYLVVDKPTFMPETCLLFFSISSSCFFCAEFVRKVLRLILPVSVRPTARIVRFAACNWQPPSIHHHVSYDQATLSRAYTVGCSLRFCITTLIIKRQFFSLAWSGPAAVAYNGTHSGKHEYGLYNGDADGPEHSG